MSLTEEGTRLRDSIAPAFETIALSAYLYITAIRKEFVPDVTNSVTHMPT